jgi:non-structural maintenance of chromosomes element 4
VTEPREAALDSKWLMMASDIGVTKAKLLKHDTGVFDVDDFISQLVLSMGGAEDVGEQLDGGGWAKIGRKALAKSKRVPTMGFM